MKVDKKTFYSTKDFALTQGAIKDVDTSGRIVTGFFNTFNFIDNDKDILVPGSAKKSIRERGPKSNSIAKIKHALNHDLTQLPGKIILLEEREIDGIKGIYFETKMSDTTLGNDTLKNYQEKIYDNHSIGFRYIDTEMIERDAKGWSKIYDQVINKEEMDKSNFVFIVKEIELFEGSTVAFGSNEFTPMIGIKTKSNKPEDFKRAIYEKINKLQYTLKHGSQSDDMMHIFELQIAQLKQMIFNLPDELIINKSKIETGNREVTKELINQVFVNNFNLD